MIGFLNGKISEIDGNNVIVDVNGVGYDVYMSTIAIQHFTLNAMAKVYTYLAVREDEVTLFGFYSKEEKYMFKKLISVSGVGPKGAIGILSSLDIQTLIVAIINQDIKRIGSAKGVGKKTAERIIVELKEAMDIGMAGASDSKLDLPINSPMSKDVQEAIEALRGLGFTQQEAYNAVNSVKDKANSLEELIVLALQSRG